MLLFELEREIAPLSRGEQFELMRFLVDLLATSEPSEDRRNPYEIERRRHEIAARAQDAEANYRCGNVQRGTVDDLWNSVIASCLID